MKQLNPLEIMAVTGGDVGYWFMFLIALGAVIVRETSKNWLPIAYNNLSHVSHNCALKVARYEELYGPLPSTNKTNTPLA